MVRFRKQTDGFSCAPLALYNTLVSYGKRVKLSRLTEEMRTDEDGTYLDDFIRVAVAYFGARIRIQDPKPWTDERKYVISVTDYGGDSHLVLLAKSTAKSVYVVNWYNSKNKFVHTWIRWETLFKYWDGYSLRVEG